jgi:hypothetical protein
MKTQYFNELLEISTYIIHTLRLGIRGVYVNLSIAKVKSNEFYCDMELSICRHLIQENKSKIPN